MKNLTPDINLTPQTKKLVSFQQLAHTDTPESVWKTTSLKVNKQTWKKLKAYCVDHDCSMQTTVDQAIREYVIKHQ